MDKVAVIERWRKLLGLRGWTIRLRDEPPPEPSRHAALTEHVFPERTAVTWVNTEADVIHELLHLVVAPLNDAFWRTDHDKALRALWTRREEEVVKRLERALLRLSRK